MGLRSKRQMMTTARSESARRHAYREKFYRTYPEKRAAKAAFRSLRKKIRPGKFRCHHWSYRMEHWRDTILMSSAVHYLLHKNIEYDQSILMYRTPEGLALDSKEAHIVYLRNLLRKHGATHTQSSSRTPKKAHALPALRG